MFQSWEIDSFKQTTLARDYEIIEDVIQKVWMKRDFFLKRSALLSKEAK